MIVAYIVVVSMALLPQIAFSFLYWRWIPSWAKNSYGRLAQLGAWCHIIFLTVLLSFLIFGEYMNPTFASYVFISSFIPLIVFGMFQLNLLKKAVNQGRRERNAVEMTNPLIDLIPARHRKYLYGALTLLVFIYGIWQANAGDWTQFLVSLVTSAVAGLATANTDVATDEGGKHSAPEE